MQNTQSADNPRRAVIVTGASSGIGRQMAVALGHAGFDLFLVGRSVTGLEETARAAEAPGVTVQVGSLDVAKPGALASYVKEAGRSHPYLFALINNAGIMHPEPILSGTAERWRAMMDINYLAPLEGAVAAVEVMRAHKRPGHIINVSSTAADMPTMGPYAASKRALEIITSTLREELAKDDIRTTVLMPGGFASQLSRDFTPDTIARLMDSAREYGVDLTGAQAERAIGNPQHLANAVLYILSQPTSISIDRVEVRPPITLKL